MKDNEMKTVINLPFGSITIHSRNKALCNGVLHSGNYKKYFSQIKYNVYFGWNFRNVDVSYRASQMKKGIYLGHNVGEPCKLHIYDNNIYIYTENDLLYKKIFWNFVIKYIFTKVCLDNNILHLKATALRDMRDGMVIMLFGKGGCGKTTLADKLCKKGFEFLSNTHCMVKESYIWGINSWIRRRGDNIEKYELATRNTCILDGIVKKRIILEKNGMNSKLIVKELNADEKYYYIKNFSAAISNYDLKEEVFDYMKNNSKTAIEYLKKEDDLVKQFSGKQIFQVSLNPFKETCIEQLYDVLKR